MIILTFLFFLSVSFSDFEEPLPYGYSVPYLEGIGISKDFSNIYGYRNDDTAYRLSLSPVFAGECIPGFDEDEDEDAISWFYPLEALDFLGIPRASPLRLRLLNWLLFGCPDERL